MARIIRQALPDPPPVYNQAYIAKLVNAVNIYMTQATAPAEVIAASYICTAPVVVDPSGDTPNSVPDTKGLPTGMLYLKGASGAAADSSVCVQAWATGNLTLTTTAQPIPGCAVTLSRNGTFLLMAAFDFNIIGNEQSNPLYGGVTGSSHQAYCDTTNKTGRYTIGLQGLFTGTSGQVLQLNAYKGGGTGTSATGPDCSLTVVWIPPAPDIGSGYFTVVTSQDPQ